MSIDERLRRAYSGGSLGGRLLWVSEALWNGWRGSPRRKGA